MESERHVDQKFENYSVEWGLNLRLSVFICGLMLVNS